MLGLKGQGKKRARDCVEKPFWISFSDLMSALMVLFLVAMAVALMAVTQGLAQMKKQEQNRVKTIQSCIDNVTDLTKQNGFGSITIHGTTIDFGSLVEFANNDQRLNAQQEHLIRTFVPKVLQVAREKTCRKWLKRVVVEGSASQVGSYLYNLNLSFLRSQRVLCILLDSKTKDALSIKDRKQIEQLFFVGGSSFNAVAKTPAEMRRVELKLEFRGLKEKKQLARDIPWGNEGTCPNDMR